VSAMGATGNGAGTTASQPSLAGALSLPRGRRGAELIMLAFSIGVVLFAYANAGLGLNGHVPTGLATYGVLFAVLMLGAHLAVRKLAPWADPLLLPLAALLNGLGLVLWAQTRGALAPIAALRETSVIFGAIIGTLVFREPFGRARIGATVLVVTGIVLLNVA